MTRFSQLALLASALLIAPGAIAQTNDFFDEELPPPAFGGSTPDFFDLPDDELIDPLEQAAAAEETKSIEMELPDPYFSSTPLDYRSPNLEKPNYAPRPALEVPADVDVISNGKTVTTGATVEFGDLAMLTDGDDSYEATSLLGIGKGVQWVQIDLGAAHELYAMLLWHFHEGERVYFDVVVQIADNAEFTENVRTVFNNDHDNSTGLGLGTDKEYVEDYRGKFLDFEKETASAIRFYSDGNTTDDFNHYVEARVWGRTAN